MTRFTLVLLTLSSVLTFALGGSHIARRDHGHLLSRQEQESHDWKAEKRTDGARFTFYNVQTGNQCVFRTHLLNETGLLT